MAPEDEFGASDIATTFDIAADAAITIERGLIADGFLELVGRRTHVRVWSPEALSDGFDTGAAIEASTLAHITGRPIVANILSTVETAIMHVRVGDTAYESAIRDLEIGTRIVSGGGADPLLAMYDSAVPVAAFYHAAARYRPEKAWLAHLRSLRVALKAGDAGAAGCEVMTWRASMIEPSSARPKRRAIGRSG